MTSRAYAAVLAAAVLLSSLAAAVTHAVAGNPFIDGAQPVGLVVALLVVAAVGVLYGTGRPAVAAVVGAVAVPVWIGFFCAWQLAGTPYPYGGNIYDIGTLTAFATRFTVSTGSADALVRGLPSDYPPLFPWLVGKASVVTGIPAWQLIGLSGVVFAALAVTCAYLLWQRLVPAPVALAVCAIPAAYQGDPRKAYEVMALCVVTPWILATFGRWPDVPRLHWLAAGIIGGLLVSDYTGYLVYTAVGTAAIVVMGVRRGTRRPYVRHILLTVATATVVAAWYLVPWLSDLLRHGGDNMWVRWWPADIRANLWGLPWDRGPLVAPMVTGGLLMLALFFRRCLWARYLLPLALSAMLYRWVFVVVHHYTGNTGIFEYTERVSDSIATIGLVLGLAEVARVVLASGRLRLPDLARTAAPAAALATVLALVVGVYWNHQRVGAPGVAYAAWAHAPALPDGTRTPYSRYSPLKEAAFPAAAVHDDIESVLGRHALPVALSYTQQIAVYYPFYLYLGTGMFSANTLSRWPARDLAVRHLAAVSDPAEFADQSVHTPFGPIDVFILRQKGSRLMWLGRTSFSVSQFSPRYFAAFHEGTDTCVFVRRGASVRHHAYPV